jgi:hypothetical protein
VEIVDNEQVISHRARRRSRAVTVKRFVQMAVLPSVVLPETPRQIAVGGNAGRQQSALRARAMGMEMPTVLSGDQSRIAHAALDAYLASGDPDGAGLYLTNEVFLYRVVGIAANDMGEVVELEDCYSLDVVCVPIHKFRANRLRVVTAAPAQHAAWRIGRGLAETA